MLIANNGLEWQHSENSKKQRLMYKANKAMCIVQLTVGFYYFTYRGEMERVNIYGQATKRTRRMPWQLEAMKDVGACEKLRGVGKQTLILRCPNGETHPA